MICQFLLVSFFDLAYSPHLSTYIVGVRILCSKIRELHYALMLTIYANYAPQISHYAPEICHYASKQHNYFLGHIPERSATFSWDSMLSDSALVLLELSEVSSPESSTSSPSLENVVDLNLVPEAKLSDRLLVLQPGSLCLAYRVTWKLRMHNTHGAKK